MSERGQFRGSNRSRGRGRGGGDGDHHSSSRGGGHDRGGHGHHHGGGGAVLPGGSSQQQASEKPKKENILDLSKHTDKKINVKFSGGREVIGTLKGHDQLLNLVMDDVEEILHDESGAKATRHLGLLVARGTLLTSIAPLDGREVIANPFAPEEDDED